jgi:acetyl-CoA carboxylase carboxyltransferase component
MGAMWEDSIKRLEEVQERASLGGGTEKIEKQHTAGKLTARERIRLLFDQGSFHEVGAFIESRIDDFGLDQKRVPGDGVVTGYGTIHGVRVFAAVEDFTVIGGTLGEYHSKKICRIQDMAYEMKSPILFLNDSGGARIEEGIASLSGYSGMFLRNTKASGVIPQIAVILGPCSGGACYSPAICDFIFMVEKIGKMFITGPKVVEAAIGEKITMEELGGARVRATVSGETHFTYETEQECLEGVRTLLSYLPENFRQMPPRVKGKSVDRSKDLVHIVPADSRKAYDVHRVIETIVDRGSFLEIQESFAKNAVIGLSRIDGETVGLIANQPNCLGGSLDCDASDKIARFIRFCDCFNIPLVVLIDVPAFYPGSRQEHSGIIRHGAKILYAFSEASVPKVSLIMRKAFGGAYIAMNSKNMGADVVYAWPIAEMAVMGADGAVDIMHQRQLAGKPDAAQRRQELIDEYEQKFLNPFIAAKLGYVDEVIHPGDTKKKIKAALDMLRGKKAEKISKKHGNIPL